jgi:hypothetical protein
MRPRRPAPPTTNVQPVAAVLTFAACGTPADLTPSSG